MTNRIGKARLYTDIKCENTKHLKVGKIQSDAGVRPTVDDVPIDVVEHFKYLGTLKSADGNCNNVIKSRIGMAKKIMLDLVPIWRDRGMNTDLKMKSDRSLVWTVLTYGEECWTMTKADEKIIEST